LRSSIHVSGFQNTLFWLFHSDAYQNLDWDLHPRVRIWEYLIWDLVPTPRLS
jgi:hypothetical protein